MPENKNFTYRIELIDECLRNRLRTWTLQALVDTVNLKLAERHGKSASRRSIQADIKYLKEEKDAPIITRKEGKATYYFYADPHFSLANLPVQLEEVEFLRDALQILRQVSDFKILQDVEDIINKLEHTIQASSENNPAFIQFEKHTTAQGTEYIDDLYYAIKEKSVLLISYQSFPDPLPKELIFHPYLLKQYRHRWFVIGRQDDRTSVTNLALDRIKGLRVSDDSYQPNDLFDPENYFNNLIGVSIPDGQAIEQIVVRVAARQAPYILTKPIHHSQELVEKTKDGDLIIRLSLIGNYELRAVLQGYGADLEVLEPLSLRLSMKNAFEQAAGIYVVMDANRLHSE